MLYSVEVGRNIVTLRKCRGMSQEMLASQAQISITWLRHIEHGRVNVTIDTLECISHVLDVELPVLFWLDTDEAVVLLQLRAARQGKAAALV